MGPIRVVATREGTDQDAADIQRVLEGDVAAFEGIVLRWQHRLVNLAWRFCRDRAIAEDMAQEAFIKVFKSLGSFRGESSFSTWLTSVALNTFRSRARTETSRTVSLDPARGAEADWGTKEEVEHRIRDEAVRRAVLTLPDHYRDAIVMFYFEEKNLAETAELLGVAEGTLKARLHRGRELLKRKVEQL